MKKTNKIIDYKIIGERIKEARKNLNITQEELAETLDVTVVYVSRVERGGTQINLKRLTQIAVALNVPIEKLITGTVVNADTYLDKEFHDILAKCSKQEQQLIYNMARVVSEIKIV